MKEEEAERKFSVCYQCCKFFTTLVLTIVILIPIIFMVGTEETFYSHKHIFRLLAESPSLREAQIQFDSHIAQLGDNFDAVNLYSAEGNDIKRSSYLQKEEFARWENLREVGQFFGFLLYEKGIPMVSRTIRYPSENVTSYVKEKDLQRPVFRKAYQFNKEDNTVIYLKRKIAKYIRRYMSRVNITRSSVDDKNYGFVGRFKNYVIDLVQRQNDQKIWMFVLNQENEEFHHASTFIKKMLEWQNENKNQKLIIVSRRPIDKDHIRIARVEVNTSRQLLLDEVKNLTKSVDSYRLPFEVNKPADVISYLIKKHEGSWMKMSRFIQNCHQSYSCQHIIRQIRKWIISQKEEDICHKSQNFINSMKDDEFNNFTSGIVEQVSIKGDKKYKKQFNLYFNIIKVDVCGLDASHYNQTAEQQQQEANQQRQAEKKIIKQKRKEKKQAKKLKKQKERNETKREEHNKNMKKRIEKMQKDHKSGKSKKEKREAEIIEKEEKQKDQKIKDKLEKANKQLEQKQQQEQNKQVEQEPVEQQIQAIDHQVKQPCIYFSADIDNIKSQQAVQSKEGEKDVEETETITQPAEEENIEGDKPEGIETIASSEKSDAAPEERQTPEVVNKEQGLEQEEETEVPKETDDAQTDETEEIPQVK